MNALFFLVRHASHSDFGQRLSGRGAGGLTADGEQQAVLLARRLETQAVGAVYSSPRERARETAEVIAEAIGVQVEVAADLDEIDFGDWTGLSFEELSHDPRWEEWNRARGASRAPNGEAMADATGRIASLMERLAEARSGARIVLVSHCDMIRGALAHYLGLPLDHLLRFEIGPASVSRVLVGDWGGRILSLNEGSS